MLKIYNQLLKENKTTSEAEKLLWKMGLSRGRTGIKFNRQLQLDKYIVDFFAPELDLIVQLDGSAQLSWSEENKFKKRRLESMGYKVLQFKEAEVLENVYRVLAEVECTIYALKKKMA